jgi:LysM repeat protein
VPVSLVRRRVLLSVVVVGGAVVGAACGSDSGGSTGSTTVPSSTTEPPTTTTTPPQATYEVQPGDTLLAIADFFGVSPAAIVAANQLASADQVAAGQVLTIPPIPPAELTITPNVAPSGEVLTFELTGAKAGEGVIFEITTANDDEPIGQAGTASPDGVATTRYDSSGDDPGVYTVVATGDRGTTAEAPYLVQGG